MVVKPVLSREQVDAFQAEMDAIVEETRAKLGAVDAAYIRRVVRTSRIAEVTGRSLLAFGWGPLSFIGGVLSLSLAKMLENMEIGHNVLHGQYDWMHDPALDGRTYEWDMTNASENWRHSHNEIHHNFTNILGKDADYGYNMFRLCAEQKWMRFHLFQPLWAVLLTMFFQWGIGFQTIQILSWIRGELPFSVIRERSGPFMKKVRRQVFKDYVLFPLLCFWSWPRVFLGNMLANLLRSVWLGVVIFCGHFTEDSVAYTEEETKNETRGDWYIRQILSSANLEGPRWLHILTGHLSHQIEHHLFPDLVARRYPEIAPRVQAICKRYGVPYNTASFVSQYATVWVRLFRYALPPRPVPAGMSPTGVGPTGVGPAGVSPSLQQA